MTGTDLSSAGRFSQAEDRFFFNKHLHAPLIEAARVGSRVVDRFIIPLIFGSVSSLLLNPTISS